MTQVPDGFLQWTPEQRRAWVRQPLVDAAEKIRRIERNNDIVVGFVLAAPFVLLFLAWLVS